jgi:ankyrin repeat protein
MAPSIMRLLATASADTRVLLHAEYHAGDPPEPRSQSTNALMAAVGMGGGVPWFTIDRSQREPLVLEAAKLALELGAEINQPNDDGRTALDAARAARYESVVTFLTERGAKPGTPNGRRAGIATNR